MKPLHLIALPLLLAACSQSTPPTTTLPSGKLGRLALPTDDYATNSLTVNASTGYTYATSQDVVAQLNASGLRFPVTAAAPKWVYALLDDQQRFAPGVLTAGVPIDVASPVQITASEGSANVSQRTMAELGNAVLVPLKLRDGRTAGLARLPLYRNKLATSADTAFILFDVPVQELTQEADVRANLSAPQDSLAEPIGAAVLTPVDVPSVLMAVAVTTDGSYSPFDVRWAVIPTEDTQQSVTLIPLGLPAYYTSSGVYVPASNAAPSSVASLRPVPAADALRIQNSFAPSSTSPTQLTSKKGRQL